MYKKIFKRLLDVYFSLVLLTILFPVIICTAIMVKIKLGGPVIFTQERPGKGGKIFKLYKFRTMTNQKGENGELLPDYMRLTSFGKLLRSTSLDELPELWNILKGDMSFIGPRPLLVEYLELYTEEQNKRHEVRPGLSGLAQVNGRNSITWEEKFHYDIKYVNKVTFLRDLIILFKTIQKVFMKEGIDFETNKESNKFQGIKKK